MRTQEALNLSYHLSYFGCLCSRNWSQAVADQSQKKHNFIHTRTVKAVSGINPHPFAGHRSSV